MNNFGKLESQFNYTHVFHPKSESIFLFLIVRSFLTKLELNLSLFVGNINVLWEMAIVVTILI